MRALLSICLGCAVSVWACAVDAQEVDSLAIYELMVSQKPKDAQAWTRLGELYLANQRLGDAKDAFQNALKREKTARVYTGLGDVYSAEGKSSFQRAFLNYRQALGEDPTYRDAQLGIARVHVKMDNEDAEVAYLKAIQLDRTYKPAYQELILWYKHAQLVQSDALLQLCEKYVSQFPDDPSGYMHLTETQVERYQYDDVLLVAKNARAQFPEDVRWLALEAQAHAVRGDSRRALILFQQYLKQVSDEERGYYEDISLVANKREQALYEAVPAKQREAFLENFWEKRDGALMSGGEARRVEHYRRVWYARTFFGRTVTPWDKRGEVYIRYGEPDYRSRSGGQNPLPPLAVQLFKEKKIARLFEQATPYRAQEPQRMQLPMMMPGSTYFPGQTYDGQDFPEDRLIASEEAEVMSAYEKIDAVRNGKLFEVNPSTFSTGWPWEVMSPNGDVRLNLPPGMTQGIEPAVPIDRNSDGTVNMPWESWVYVYLGDGKEFVFADPFMNGDWDFPALPNNLWHSALVSEVNNASSAVQYMATSAEVPEYFDVPPGAELMGFYYDTASFRGADGQTALEVYFGIPPEQVALNREGERVEMVIERTLVMADANSDSVYRTTDALTFRKAVDENKLGGLFVELASISVPPGDYILGVKLADRTSGKWGMYRQEVSVPSFADSLSLSDIEMAWTVSDSPNAEKFKKGDVWVVPAPTRSYETTRDAQLYYEVYNLKQDAFGQAMYQVTYTIRPNVENRGGALGVLVGGVRQMFAASAEPEFTVQYERTVNATEEPVFFELETEALKPGLKLVEVEVRDLLANRSVKRRAMFNVVTSSVPVEAKDPYDAAFEEAMKGLLGGDGDKKTEEK